ncbi:MAG: agmatine deiminase family protein [Bacteroidales bacterium]|nr:agmatine deiminase family protein [Bacteroidales bacterium]
MKKILLFLSTLLWVVGAMAQYATTEEDMARQWRLMKHQRDYSNTIASSDIPLGGEAVSPKGVQSLPDDRVWFPGEWEEVSAIVVTPYYSYYPDSNLGTGTYYADPVVTGLAEYYRYDYSRGWVSTGIYGPYRSVIDTTSDFGKVFFYLMDGIQLGGAEAWVRVEKEEDSAKVLRTLSRFNLRHDNVRFIVGTGNSFWYRDCGPICFYYGDEDSVAMMDFEYYPGRALDDSLPSLIRRQMGIPNYINTIEWEGGNCLVDGAGFLLTSDAVYSNNRDTYGQITWDGHNPNSIHYTTKRSLTSAQTREALRSLLGQRETHVLPAFQYDGGTGHIDLYVDMCEENGFVFSNMPDNYSSWTDYRTGQRNRDTLCSYTSIFDRQYYDSFIPFPSKDNGSAFANQTEYDRDYTRTYSNHTFVNDVILQPCFSRVVGGVPSASWDVANIEELKKAYPGYTIYPVDVRTFDGSGGAIHCVTKQIPADNPVRILHKSIVGSVTDMRGSDIPVSAIITNRSGIAHAECVYRIGGGEWDTVSLTANGNRFYGMMGTNGIDEVRYDTVVVTDSMTYYDTVVVGADTVVTDSVVYTSDTTITLHDTLVTVEYYLSATSNNGKTITKPITAHQGGYYSFYYDGTTQEMDSSRYDFATEPMSADRITFLFDANRTYLDTSSAPDPHPVGIADEVEGRAFGEFYPNPATNYANMAIDLADGGTYKVEIIDNMGRIVHTTRLQTVGSIVFTIRTESLSTGLYTVRFSGNGESVVRRLVVGRTQK